ncbi:MAG: xanthine dehydrogenase family protein molybdopterin-binding subunit [Alphaproteobacteria bacterium]|nr:xanthine dehydrogenase family protein molybdopterin-binding subunit [Alphaproteobacteria bacterium]
MGQFGIGQAVRRIEDVRFITGAGRYIDDVSLPRQAYLAFVRSPHAHAAIKRVDLAAAKTMPGVLGAWAGADLEAEIKPLPCPIPIKNRDGSFRADPPRRVLAVGFARHVGDAVAAVVAETPQQARDAAEAVAVDYDPLPSVTDLASAARQGSPKVWETLKDNIVFLTDRGNPAAVDANFAKAAHVTRLKIVNNRVVVHSMEPRGAVAEYDAKSGMYTLYTGTQGPFRHQNLIGDMVLGIEKGKLRVVTPDVGGGFGMKLFLYGEPVLALWSARKLGRPVKWTSDRSEAFLTDTHGRDHLTEGELALDKDGRFIGLRVKLTANMGAYLSTFAPFIPTDASSAIYNSIYDHAAVHVAITGVFTNTTPVDAYRGAGRPEANYLVERLIDQAAHEMKIDRAELRRRNYIRHAQFPYKTAMGLTYDSGNFRENLDEALKRSDLAGFEARRAEARKRGRLRGIGFASYVEIAGGGPMEQSKLTFEEDGYVTLTIGTQSNGQGHETAYAQILTDKLGVPFDRIRVRQGDGHALPDGGGTGGSRSALRGGGAIIDTVAKVVEKGKPLAAEVLEAAAADIVFEHGQFKIAGTDRAIGVIELARRARAKGGEGLDSLAVHNNAPHAFPNGCHVCEVEIDPETGVPAVVAYTVVDDFGEVVNPLLVEGQVHGGVAQGLGQALLEHCVYDQQSGQILTGSPMDYALPRADDFPDIAFSRTVDPCRTNPLGIKGCGEAGAVGAPPATVNAVVDALAHLGVRHVDMPVTAEKLWRVIRAAKT